MTATEEHVISMLEALPPSDRRPDGMPAAEAVHRIMKSLSPTEQREMAERTIYRVSEMHLELLATIGAAERLLDHAGEVHYKRLRDLTPAEDHAIDMLIDAVLNAHKAVAVEA